MGIAVIGRLVRAGYPVVGHLGNRRTDKGRSASWTLTSLFYGYRNWWPWLVTRQSVVSYCYTQKYSYPSQFQFNDNYYETSVAAPGSATCTYSWVTMATTAALWERCVMFILYFCVVNLWANWNLNCNTDIVFTAIFQHFLNKHTVHCSGFNRLPSVAETSSSKAVISLNFVSRWRHVVLVFR